MRPVAVTEILTYEERLGITETVEPPGIRGSVRHLLRYAGADDGQRMMPFPHTLLILPPAVAEGVYETDRNGSGPPPPYRNITCMALCAQRITVFLRQFSVRTGIPVFSSCYDDTLLHSRLTGLLRERGRRRVMVHGVLVRVEELGVLLLGKSGIGKTACGLALMNGGNRWVADDAVILEGRGDAVYGRGHWKTGGRIAVRGRGILRAADLLGAGRLLRETRVDLVVRLVRRGERGAMTEGGGFQRMVGVPLPLRDLSAEPDPRRAADGVTDCVRRLSIKESVVGWHREERKG